MQKIPTIFERDEATNRRTVTRVGAPGCEWVMSGEGVATRKYDGTCCMVSGDRLFRRMEITMQRLVDNMPAGFEPVETDPVTSKVVGWVPVSEADPQDRWHREAMVGQHFEDGTYELVGPKVQGNPEGYERHTLVAHATAEELPGAPRDFDGLRDWLLAHPYEGIVWHHPDGRMAKLKRRDFMPT